MKNINRYNFILLLLLHPFVLRAQPVASNSSYATNPPNFSQLSYDQADKAINDDALQIRILHVKTVGPEYLLNLVSQVRHGNLSDDKKVLAIFLLGEIAPSEINSIETFIENIDLKALKLDPKTGFPRWGTYPAKEALFKSGKAAIVPLLNHLPNETKDLRRQLMCEVLVEIEGWNKPDFDKAKGQKIVQAQIREKLDSESDPVKRTNLELALKEAAK